MNMIGIDTVYTLGFIGCIASLINKCMRMEMFRIYDEMKEIYMDFVAMELFEYVAIIAMFVLDYRIGIFVIGLSFYFDWLSNKVISDEKSYASINIIGNLFTIAFCIFYLSYYVFDLFPSK